MTSSTQRTIELICLILAVLILVIPNIIRDGMAQGATTLIVGLLKDSQDQPVSGAKVTLMDPAVDLIVNVSESQDNGRFALVVPKQVPDELSILIDRPHYYDERSLTYIDWNVNFLIMGMMIVIAVVENTGIFQWLANFAYRISRGNSIPLLIILMLITGIALAFLDNVTTMLLMTPTTVQIALAIGVNPLAILIPEVMASNVIGASTLAGTPTKILVGSFARLSFINFLRNLTPGVLLALVCLVLYGVYVNPRDLEVAHEASSALTAKLAESDRITEPQNLRKAARLGAGMLLLLSSANRFMCRLQLPPASAQPHFLCGFVQMSVT